MLLYGCCITGDSIVEIVQFIRAVAGSFSFTFASTAVMHQNSRNTYVYDYSILSDKSVLAVVPA